MKEIDVMWVSWRAGRYSEMCQVQIGVGGKIMPRMVMPRRVNVTFWGQVLLWRARGQCILYLTWSKKELYQTEYRRHRMLAMKQLKDNFQPHIYTLSIKTSREQLWYCNTTSPEVRSKNETHVHHIACTQKYRPSYPFLHDNPTCS